MSTDVNGGTPRRVVVGIDGEGRSRVMDIQVPTARIVRRTGAVVEELWRQESVPATSETPAQPDAMAPNPPPAGLSLRQLTLPPGTGTGDVQLNASEALFLAVVVSGEAVLVLEAEELQLGLGDSLVLPGHAHGWRNVAEVPAVLVCAVVPLQEDSTA